MVEVIIALIVAAGGTGGLVTLYKAWADHQENKVAKEEEIDDRFMNRLEARLAILEARHDEDSRYILKLVSALAAAGIEVPPRNGG